MRHQLVDLQIKVIVEKTQAAARPPVRFYDACFFLRNRNNGASKIGIEMAAPHNAPNPNIPPMDATAACSFVMTFWLPSANVHVISTVWPRVPLGLVVVGVDAPPSTELDSAPGQYSITATFCPTAELEKSAGPSMNVDPRMTPHERMIAAIQPIRRGTQTELFDLIRHLQSLPDCIQTHGA